MFKFVENNRILIQLLLGAIALTFIFVGFGSYSSLTDESYLVKIGNTKIYPSDVDQELNGQPVDAAARQQVLEGMVQRTLIVLDARANGLVVTKTALQQAIEVIPPFQNKGQFDLEKYKTFLDHRRMSAEQFEEQVSEDILVKTQLAPFATGQFVSQALVNYVAALLGEKRVVRALIMQPRDFSTQVNTDEAALAAYYQAHAERFVRAQGVRLQYVVLSQARLAGALVLSDEEVQKYYQQHKPDFSTEQRRAAHILLAVHKDASAEQKARIKAEAQSLLKVVLAHPQEFAQLAQTRSQDPGSATKGGDLGFFPRGVMTKPFEDAVFSMKPGQIKLIESDFGFHIVRLEAIDIPDFNSVKAVVADKLKQLKAAAMFKTQGETLSDIAYNQPDSLQGIEKSLKLAAYQSDWVSSDDAGANPILSNPKVLAAAFSDDVFNKKHNSAPIDIGDNTRVVIRVIDRRPKRKLLLSEVKDQIKTSLIEEKGAILAQKHGQAILAALKAGKDEKSEKWSPEYTLLRVDPSSLPADDLRIIFSLEPSSAGAYAGLKHPNGLYVIYRLDKVIPSAPLSDEERRALVNGLVQVNTNTQTLAYLDLLRRRYPIKMGQPLKKSALDPETSSG